MTKIRRKNIDAIVTVSWLLMDSLWAFGFNKAALIPGFILLIASIASIYNATRSNMTSESAIFCWGFANLSWLLNDTIPHFIFSFICGFFFTCAWIIIIASLKVGLVKRGGKYWK